VEILDEYKIVFKFRQPSVAFINVQASIIDIVSPDSFQGPNISPPIGTGPYILNSAISNYTNLYLTRNPNYFRGIPPFENIDYFMYGNHDDLEAAIENNKGDFVVDDGGGLWGTDDSYWEHINSSYLDWVEVCYFNHQVSELSDVRVRQAINYAINKEVYIENTSKDGTPSQGVIPSNMIYYYETQGFPYDVEKANKLLDQAGYPKNDSGYRFDLEIMSGFWREDNIRNISTFLEEIGIKVDIVIADNWLDKLEDGDYEVFNIGWIGMLPDPSSFTYMMLHSSGILNSGNYTNHKMDKYIELGQQTPVHQEREHYYKKIQQIAQTDAPYLLLKEGEDRYLRSYHVASFISLSKNGRIGLKYTQGGVGSIQQDKYSKHHDNVSISEKAIYFPFTDTIIESLNQQPLTVDISTSRNAETITKYFQLEVDQNDTDYRVRFYYDNEEITNKTNAEALALFRWDGTKNQWEELETTNSSTTLRYVEVILKGDSNLFKLVESVIRITYHFLPMVSLLIGGILTVALITVVVNRSTFRAFKERYSL
jgi:ABC-type transport system substrate-binding protein